LPTMIAIALLPTVAGGPPEGHHYTMHSFSRGRG